jgi:hypothetical protein
MLMTKKDMTERKLYIELLLDMDPILSSSTSIILKIEHPLTNF